MKQVLIVYFKHLNTTLRRIDSLRAFIEKGKLYFSPRSPPPLSQKSIRKQGRYKKCRSHDDHLVNIATVREFMFRKVRVWKGYLCN